MEARGVRADPDTLGSNRTSASDTGSRPKSQLGPTQPNPSQIRPTQPNPGPQRSPRRGPNRDLSTLTLPNGPNLTQRSGKLCDTRVRQTQLDLGCWWSKIFSLTRRKRKQLDNCITRQIYLHFASLIIKTNYSRCFFRCAIIPWKGFSVSQSQFFVRYFQQGRPSDNRTKGQ